MTTVYLKIRRLREAEWDLPPETATSVDGKSWKKILEMEKKAFKMIEALTGLVDLLKLPTPPPPPVKVEAPKGAQNNRY